MPRGNAYIADLSNHRALKVDPTVRYWWKVNTADGVTFRYLRDIAVDSNGNIYVVDYSNHRIVKYDTEGNHIATWGTTGTSGSSGDQFSSPNGIAIDSNDNIYIADSNNHRIKKYSPDGTLIKILGSSGADEGQFSLPRGLGIDSEGNLYVAEEGNKRVQKLDLKEPPCDVQRYSVCRVLCTLGCVVDTEGVYVSDLNTIKY